MPVVNQAGSYRAKVIGKDLGYTSNGKEQIAVGLEVVDGGPQHGHHITWYGFFTDAAFPYTVEKLRTLGWQGSDISDLSTVGSVGEVEIVVNEEEYQGKKQHKVQFINTLGSTGMGIKNVMDDAAKKAFAARMKGLVLGLDPSQAKKNAAPSKPSPQRSQREEPPPPSDGDIPF